MVLAELCVRTGEVEKALEIGRALGLDMIGFVVPPEGLARLEGFRKKRDWREKPRVALGVEIRTERPGQVKNLASRVRKSAEVLVAFGGTEELNRAVVETPEIDVLMNHVVNGRCGINHVLARIAKKNNVSIGFDFSHVMSTYRLGRVQEFSALTDTARVVRRFKPPFLLTSGAQEPWDMRSPSELMAFGRILGFTEAQARQGLSDSIVRENMKRLSGKWVMPGVEIE